MNQTEIVLTKLDRFFAPDIKVRVNDEGEITGFVPVSHAGAEFLLRQVGQLAGLSIDEALHRGAGLTFEVHE